jgi:chemotaxis family two-component system response regulator Rcp1
MNTQTPHILLIEDNPADANLVEEAFSEAQFTCELSVMRDGAEAIEFIDDIDAGTRHACPDLVLLDLNLPKVGGRAVLERVRSSPKLRKTIVLIISSSDAPSDRKQVMELGADEYFRKPSSLQQFMELGPKVRTMLKHGKRDDAEGRA